MYLCHFRFPSKSAIENLLIVVLLVIIVDPDKRASNFLASTLLGISTSNIPVNGSFQNHHSNSLQWFFSEPKTIFNCSFKNHHLQKKDFNCYIKSQPGMSAVT